MKKISRRVFLNQAGAAVVAAAVAPAVLGAAPDAGTARVIIDPARRLASLDARLLGSFLEHLGRAIYGGIYDPASKLADSNGFRKDVLEEIRRMRVPIIRYPGGNFVSGYHWLDGVGPREARPRVLDRAWNSIETNQFGTNEFIAWCRATGAEPLLAVNLGTGAPETAAALVEYCNVEAGTRWSDLRRKHGVEKPHAVKAWCLGNEMDGPWQIGHMTAPEYGRKAADAARQMRAVDRSIQLVACGSSGPGMPTYLEWDRQVLEECYNDVDGISLHRYFNEINDAGGESRRFLALNLAMERQMEEVAAVVDEVRGRRRSKKKVWLSFDEWNIWYRDYSGDGHRQAAPHLLEEVYTLEDALLVGGILNSLLRHAARVRIACLAQLVNVIAPILTNEDGLVRQAIFYPYSWALEYARGDVLDLQVDSPAYDVKEVGPISYLDVAGTLDAETGRTSLFMLNRDLDRARQVEIVWHEGAPAKTLACETLTGPDLKATNTFAEPKRVLPQPLAAPRAGTRTTVELPARSYTVLQLVAS